MPPGRVVHMVFDVKAAPHDSTLGHRNPYAPPPPDKGGGAYGFRRRTEVVHTVFAPPRSTKCGAGVFYETSNCL